MLFFFFKQKTAYEMRISDWSSDVCSSDLVEPAQVLAQQVQHVAGRRAHAGASSSRSATARRCASRPSALASITAHGPIAASPSGAAACTLIAIWKLRSEEHTSELQSLMRISYAVFCLKKKNEHTEDNKINQ